MEDFTEVSSGRERLTFLRRFLPFDPARPPAQTKINGAQAAHTVFPDYDLQNE
jgi:hypothetical protein